MSEVQGWDKNIVGINQEVLIYSQLQTLVVPIGITVLTSKVRKFRESLAKIAEKKTRMRFISPILPNCSNQHG